MTGPLPILSNCHLCSLRQAAAPVAGFGPTNAKIAIIGSYPGMVELRQRKPLSGPAGTVLDAGLKRAQIARRKCYVTNVIKCPPRQSTGHVAPFCAYMCQRQWLVPELATLTNLQLVLALGSYALWAFEPAAFVEDVHGHLSRTQLPNGQAVWLFPAHSPGAFLRSKPLPVWERTMDRFRHATQQLRKTGQL